ncbi:putative DNA-directed RNA polymerase III subunit [Triangularia verruculosa]|uniref:DNA-directed RNA polymerase III subunit RPC6 n=1 Tax=Triangularia verruculosa TaxID=2587418 RepID=A0AAN6XGK6_9PEZI|nr:putative DNA-directed RNA polymerase III subunit [Triangularia verruculosa]
MAAIKSEGELAKLTIIKDELYETMKEHGSEEREFSQADIKALNVIPNNDTATLLKVIQALTDEKLLVGFALPGGEIRWRWRGREDARKYTSLPDEATMLVYGIIDSAGQDGVWVRHIKARANIQDATFKACIKVLETKGYITSMTNVEMPNRKMYIRADLKPSERATGGPWFTDGELDEAFIKAIEGIIFEYIKTRSAYMSRGTSVPQKLPRKGVVTGEVARGVKRTATDISHDDATPVPPTTKGVPPPRKKEMFLPMPAGYKKYPTVNEITEFIHMQKVSSAMLGVADIQALVDVLVFDGLIEPIAVNSRKGYRVVRPTKQDTLSYAKRKQEQEAHPELGEPELGPPPVSSAVTEAPCGKCPVFELCQEGGPVAPSTCVYFQEWLGLEEPAVLSGTVPP